jgi:hypothetical protein
LRSSRRSEIRPAPTQSGPRMRSIARRARNRMRTEGGGYRRDHLRALAQRVEVDAKEVRIMGSKAYSCAPSSPPRARKRRVLALPVLYRSGAPYGNRTRVSAVKGRRPRPLDEGRRSSRSPLETIAPGAGHSARRHIEAFSRCGKEAPPEASVAAAGKERSPLPGIRHGGPWLLRGQRGALLQELDGMLVGRTHERHLSVARRAVDGHAGLHQPLA